MSPAPVTAVVPVKLLGRAKTRLELPDEQRRALALAFVVDTVSALLASPLVRGAVVVTADPEVTERMTERPVRVVPENGAGLGAAVREGIRAAGSWVPGMGVAVVPGDLPCLRAEDVTDVITRGLAVTGGAFVPDRASTGTTVLVHPSGGAAVARYGPDSAARHRALGLVPLDDAPVRARHDVDTLDDLRLATTYGLGPETRRLTSRWRTSP